ncbi:RecQ family ATP-dependent DNA helicase [Peribacillus kribbensis]|uniref:RecQ family ATP-dependent DNA helicase n=1 Tax=Peribacillus kribbensis TaxID=356658 RepID=UPI0003FD54C6|nr:RecQ family ATP-dependent DNA helicase [Peribacillus kribbensis]
MKQLEVYLEKYFGYKEFREGQKETISQLLQGTNTLSMLPTGTGKSLCYQLPVYITGKPAVIVSPLLSLMQDQAEQLRVRGEKRVISFNSFLSFEERQTAMRNLHSYKFIFVSPEMLQSRQLLAGLSSLDIGFFVVDEAHCISQWGYDFRPDYLQLKRVRKELSNPLTLALTATATPQVRKDIIRQLGEGEFAEILSSIDRKNIGLIVEKAESYEDKLQRMAELAKKLGGPGIIYFSSRKSAETAAEYLSRNLEARTAYYHGALEQEQRILLQQQFINGELDVICATSAFGMGINKQDIKYVIHFQMPMQMESYIQEIGRAGRDGSDSIAILLYLDGDEGLQWNFIENELPSDSQIHGLFHFLEGNRPGTLPELQKLLFSNELGSLLNMNEIQLRIIQHLFQEVDSLDAFGQLKEQIFEYISERKHSKIHKLQQFMDWVKGHACRRETASGYFNQELLEKPVWCCDICGLKAEQYFSEGLNRKKAGSKPFHWKEELREILLPVKQSL